MKERCAHITKATNKQGTMSRGLSTDATVEDLDYHIDQARDMLRYVQNDPSFTAAEKVRFAEVTRGKIANIERMKERLLAASNRSSHVRRVRRVHH